MNDLRYALRSFSKSPAFFLVAVLVLGLGIGANTAVFSVVNTVYDRGNTSWSKPRCRPQPSTWQRRFHGNSNILGKRITLNDTSYTVIGVMPAAFRHPDMVEMWIPLALDASWQTNRTRRPLRVAARLKPGVTIEQAQTEMDRITTALLSIVSMIAGYIPARRATRVDPVVALRNE